MEQVFPTQIIMIIIVASLESFPVVAFPCESHRGVKRASHICYDAVGDCSG